MKKIVLGIMAIALFASCTTIRQTATVNYPNSKIRASVIADLDVSPNKIAYTYTPDRDVRRGGDDNVIAAAIQEALYANGDADVLVALECAVECRPSVLWLSSIREITVTGYPATYKNFHNVKDEFWYQQKDCDKCCKPAGNKHAKCHSVILK